MNSQSKPLNRVITHINFTFTDATNVKVFHIMFGFSLYRSQLFSN